MTKREYLECDVCEERIEEASENRLVRFKPRMGRWLKLLVYRWRGGYSNPGYRWVSQRVDICGDCWDEVKREVKRRVTDG